MRSFFLTNEYFSIASPKEFVTLLILQLSCFEHDTFLIPSQMFIDVHNFLFTRHLQISCSNLGLPLAHDVFPYLSSCELHNYWLDTLLPCCRQSMNRIDFFRFYFHVQLLPNIDHHLLQIFILFLRDIVNLNVPVP
uniref:Uncharacterized protein n=1 Tax=Cacopsylla melanoneura TaxID=428564 RepID=A0A8D8SQ19_9HEMI